MRRREFLTGGTIAGLAPFLPGCAGGEDAYQAALARMSAPLPNPPEAVDLVRYATLAGNGHNAQPWRFRIAERSIEISPDFSRRTPVVDPDDHHLFASLGCAAENLHLAARARGLSGAVAFDPAEDGALTVDIAPAASAAESALFRAIPERQCTRATFDGASAPGDAIDRLARDAARYGVEIVYVSEPREMARVLDLVVAGNSRQIDDPDFVAELERWIRFNAATAAATGDGLYAASSGNPTAPDWLGGVLFDWFFTKDAENAKYAEQVRSSAGLVVFVAPTDDPEGWVAAGRAYQRAALRLTAEGLKHAFVNQAVEVAEMRAELRGLLGLGERRPNLVLRIGYGAPMPKSLRRPVSDVLI